MCNFRPVLKTEVNIRMYTSNIELIKMYTYTYMYLESYAF